MQSYLQSASLYLNALSLRERILMLLVACSVIYIAWDTLLLSKFEQQYKQQLSEQQQLNHQQQEVDTTIIQISKKIAQSNDETIKIKQNIRQRS